MFYKSFLIIAVLSLSTRAEFPNGPNLCKYGDSDCIVNVINLYLKEKSAGDPTINLVNFDPLELKEVDFKQLHDSPVNLNLLFSNCKLYGIKTGKVLKVKGFGKDLTEMHEIQLKFNYLEQLGDYKVNGKVLLLPVRGEGKSNFTLEEPLVTLRFVGVPENKDGAVYMKVDKFQFMVEPKQLYMKLDNLFNGDKELGDTMNKFVNDNWKEIFNEFRDEFNRSYGQTIGNIFAIIFSKYPYEKYFAE